MTAAATSPDGLHLAAAAGHGSAAMNRRPRICLFTSFHPDHGGGGSACLASIIPHFTRIEVRWLFLGRSDSRFPNSHCIGEPLMGGGLVRDVTQASLLWAGLKTPALRRVTSALAGENADGFWLVAMNEGILAGNALAAVRQEPFHVSVQDDQAEAICRRSRRYRHLEAPALRAWNRLLRRAASVDVISEGMRSYYRTHRRLDSFVFHPFVPRLPPAPSQPTESELFIGHLGTLYSDAELPPLVEGAGIAARRLGRRLRLAFVGDNRINPADHRRSLPPDAVLEVSGSLPEEQALARLSSAHLLCAIYPFEERCRVFRQTSLPTKLSSYLKLQRPVLALTPPDSTLAEWVNVHRLGRVCPSPAPEAIAAEIITAVNAPPAREAFERAREDRYGMHNVVRMEDALLDLTRRQSGGRRAGACTGNVEPRR